MRAAQGFLALGIGKDIEAERPRILPERLDVVHDDVEIALAGRHQLAVRVALGDREIGEALGPHRRLEIGPLRARDNRVPRQRVDSRISLQGAIDVFLELGAIDQLGRFEQTLQRVDDLEVALDSFLETVAEKFGLALEARRGELFVLVDLDQVNREHDHESGEHRHRHAGLAGFPGRARLRQPDEHQRHDEHHADTVAGPPGNPVEQQVVGRDDPGAEQQRDAQGRADEAGDRAAEHQQAEDTGRIDEAAFEIDPRPDQPMADEPLQRRGDAEAERDQQRPVQAARVDRWIVEVKQVGERRADQQARPQARPVQQDHRQRDARRRPDRGGVAGRRHEVPADIGGDEVKHSDADVVSGRRLGRPRFVMRQSIVQSGQSAVRFIPRG